MSEQLFWELIDKAWNAVPELNTFRQDVHATLNAGKERFEAKYADEEPVIPVEEHLFQHLESSLRSLSKEDLQAFDGILAQKLYDIDRSDVHEYTDGGDDGLLYCRGFIVAMGKTYYDAVNQDPSLAMFDWECEHMAYVSMHIYEDLFGAMPQFGISRETGSNIEGWA